MFYKRIWMYGGYRRVIIVISVWKFATKTQKEHLIRKQNIKNILNLTGGSFRHGLGHQKWYSWKIDVKPIQVLCTCTIYFQSAILAQQMANCSFMHRSESGSPVFQILCLFDAKKKKNYFCFYVSQKN